MNTITKVAIAAFVAAPIIVYTLKNTGGDKAPHNDGVSAVVESGISADKLYAQKCASCHGQNGEGSDAHPKLAGIAKDVFVAKIEKHSNIQNTGANPVMNSQASSLSKQDIEALSVYVSSLKPVEGQADANKTAKKQELKLEKGGGGD